MSAEQSNKPKVQLPFPMKVENSPSTDQQYGTEQKPERIHASKRVPPFGTRRSMGKR
jgi:hypothetical protein